MIGRVHRPSVTAAVRSWRIVASHIVEIPRGEFNALEAYRVQLDAVVRDLSLVIALRPVVRNAAGCDTIERRTHVWDTVGSAERRARPVEPPFLLGMRIAAPQLDLVTALREVIAV